MSVVIGPINTLKDAWRALDELARVLNATSTAAGTTTPVPGPAGPQGPAGAPGATGPAGPAGAGVAGGASKTMLLVRG